MSGAPELPQSQTPLVWLPPDIAKQVSINQFILSGSLAVRSCAHFTSITTTDQSPPPPSPNCSTYSAQAWLWDVLVSLSEEYQMLKKGVHPPDIAYILSRCVS